ncbi:MAG: transglutaminase-like domain-containing protein [Actinomycetota bacterium]
MTRLAQARVAVIGAMGVVVALAAGEIFDQIRFSLLVGPMLAAAGIAITIERKWFWQFGAALAAVVLGVAVAVLAAGGGFDDIVASFTSGPQRLLSTDWPSPRRADLIGTVEAGLTSLVALAAALATRPRFHLVPLLPIFVAFVLVIAASAPSDVHLAATIALVALGLALALLRAGTPLADRVALIRGERWVPLMIAATLVVGGAAGTAVAFSDRADPRRNDPADRSATLLDPIEATVALQQLEEPIVLHEISVAGVDTVPRRWRTAALSDYDGRRWSPNLTLRPIGRRLGAEVDGELSASVRFLDDDLQLVPLPGQAVIVDAEIETDLERSLVRLVERPDPEQVVDIVTGIDPQADSIPVGQVGSREIDESVSGLVDFAQQLVADGAEGSASDDLSVIEQLQVIERVLSEEYELDQDAAGGGVARALVDRFLRDTERGNQEQFVTGFVLLARALGADARVATGFEVTVADVDRTDSGFAFELTSENATLWPEVRIGEQWVAFDPVPPNESVNINEEPPEPQTQAPAAPQPPIAEPPEETDEPVVTERDDGSADSAGLPDVIQFVVRLAAVVGVLLIPILLAVLIILVTKRRQRTRRLAGAPPEKITGAWALATNRLVDAGVAIRPSDTNNDIAEAGSTVAPTADRELRRLSTLASAATFGRPTRADLLAEDAEMCLDGIEESIASNRTRWQQLRWRLSTRSLRRSTRSPV